MQLELPSKITKFELEGRIFYVKRDELVNPFLAGNKFRKLYALIQTSSDKYNHIISYGGTQSNAMLAIAAMCKQKGWSFTYYTKPLSRALQNEECGNYFEAKKLGMNHIEIAYEYYRDFIASLMLNLDEKTFIIDQGGAIKEANIGLEVLAQEIKDANIPLKALATPAGTGTTALFLALSLPEFIVYTTPCIGDVAYLREQLNALAPIPPNLIILEPKKKYHFAKPYKEFLDIYQKLLSKGIEFDLVYAPNLWMALLEGTNEDILYIHSGGISGNESMLKRYRQKKFLEL